MLLLSILLAASIAVNIWLWRRNRRNAKKVAFLFNAIDDGDYNFRFPDEKLKEDKLLSASLNRIKLILEHARDEQRERERYYEVILDSVDTGIVVIEEDRGVVLRTNKAARKMLGRDVITHISQVEERLKAFATRTSYTSLKGRRVRIVGFSDIHGELANQEIDAWVKLIRVLTHEIMNTITPIASLSETLLPSSEGKVREGLSTISQTSRELMAFVKGYREFTHVPTPRPKLLYVGPFLERMKGQASGWLHDGQRLTVSVEPKDLLVYADEGLLSRVISNLLKNAAEATANGGDISVRAYTGGQDAVTIDVIDDGEPIDKELAAHIFVPFFTTKEGGNGIGLSLSRRIMRAMGGAIDLVGDARKTTFRLTFQ